MANRASTARARPSSSSPPTSPSSPRRSTFEGAIGVGWSLGATVLWHVLSGPAAARFAGAVVVDMTARVQERRGMGPRPLARGLRGAQHRDPRRFSSLRRHRRPGRSSPSRRREHATWPTGRASNSPATMPPRSARSGRAWSARTCAPCCSKIEHPTLIVHGARSRLYGDDTADHLVAALPERARRPLRPLRPRPAPRRAVAVQPDCQRFRGPPVARPRRPSHRMTRRSPMSTRTSLKTGLKIRRRADRARRLRRPRLRPGRAAGPGRRRAPRSRPPPPTPRAR